MKTRITIIAAMIGVFGLAPAPSQAADTLTCKAEGIVETVTPQNKARLIREGFQPFPGDPRIMYKTVTQNPTFGIPRSAMKWVGTYYEAYTKTDGGEDLVIGIDSNFSYFRTWNPAYAAELGREFAFTGPCWW